MEEHARNAYEAMREAVHGVSTISGKALPPWDELPTGVTTAWIAALQATENLVSPPP